MINHLEESFEEIIKNISTNDFKNELNRRIFEIILENINAGQDKIVSSISNIEDENLQAHVSTIMVSDYEITSVKKCIEDIIVTYNKDKLISRKMEIIKDYRGSRKVLLQDDFYCTFDNPVVVSVNGFGQIIY